VKRRVSLAALTVLELSPLEQVSVAADAGYDCVGLRLIPATPEEKSRPLNAPELALRLDATGVRVLDVEIFRLTPRVVIAEFEPFVAAAAELKATELLVAGSDADETRLAESFGRFCDLAARYGLNADLEPMPWTGVPNVAAAKRILEAAGRANAGLLIDAIHFFRAGDSISDLAALPGSWFRYVQLCDAPAPCPTDMGEVIRQARADRLLPGEGALDLRGLLRALPQDIPVSLEIPLARPVSAIERARRALEAARRYLRARSCFDDRQSS
jgi:sugar phosphate isomerase/epimerase